MKRDGTLGEVTSFFGLNDQRISSIGGGDVIEVMTIRIGGKACNVETLWIGAEGMGLSEIPFGANVCRRETHWIRTVGT